MCPSMAINRGFGIIFCQWVVTRPILGVRLKDQLDQTTSKGLLKSIIKAVFCLQQRITKNKKELREPL